MKIYITKYVLSKGIIHCVDATYVNREDTGEFFRTWDSHTGFTVWRKGKYAHETRNAAIVHAETMRAEKVERLRRQIEKLNAMEFVLASGIDDPVCQDEEVHDGND